MALELPEVKQWHYLQFIWGISAVKFGGFTTGKTVDSSGKAVVIPLISSVISVNNSGNTTKFYH